jgi:lysyl endopeptidase
MKKLYALLVAAVLFSLNVNAQISAGGVPESFSRPNLSETFEVMTMPVLDIPAIKAAEAARGDEPRPYKFGENIFVDYSLQNSGTWEELENGRLWRLAIKSEGAFSLNFIFSDFFMPAGAEFFIYNEQKDYVLGAFTSQNNREDRAFGTDIVKGDMSILEYYEPNQVRGQGSIQLKTVTHGYLNIFDITGGTSGSCNNDINCPGWEDWQDDKRSVGIMIVQGSGFCTGTMVVDVPQSGTPYFLGANHCMGGSQAAWIYRFNYEHTVCNQSATPVAQSLQGSVLRASSANSDFALIELDDVPPANYNVYYAGWTNENIAATQATGIHHPSGDVKKISRENNALTSSAWGGTPANSHWMVPGWDDGVTEGGSSGSGLWDQNHRLVGQLHGGASQCGGSDLSDLYGKFSLSWLGGGTNATQLKHWLDPDATGVVAVDGWDPNAPVVSNDAKMNAVTEPVDADIYCTADITPVVEIKNSGADTLTSVDIYYNYDGASPGVYNWTGSLPTNGTESVTLPLATLAGGSHSFTAATVNPNGNTDENSANDTLSVAFTVIPDGMPAADFTANNQQVCEGRTIVYTNQTLTCEQATYAWTFQGGSPSSSTGASPTITYNNQGTYNVRLIATNSFGSDTVLLTGYVTVIDAPQLTTSSTVDHVGSPNDGTATVEVSGGTPPYTYIWSNGQSSTSANPTNTITGLAAGNYNVQVTDGNGCVVSKSVFVSTNTGVEEQELEALVSVYPNPAKDMITVELPTGKQASVCELYTVTGAKMDSFSVAGQQRFTLDLKTYAKGIYLLRISIEGQLITKKISVTK